MTYGATHPVQTHHHDTGMHVMTWIVSMLGVLAAAVGAWIMLAPDDGTISVFGSSWAASDLTETWGPWLLIVGGAVAGIGVGFAALRDRQHHASWWLVTAEALLALVGVAAVIVGIAILI